MKVWLEICRCAAVRTMALCVKLEGSSMQTVVRSSVSSFAVLANMALLAPTLLSRSMAKDTAPLGAAESIKNS